MTDTIAAVRRGRVSSLVRSKHNTRDFASIVAFAVVAIFVLGYNLIGPVDPTLPVDAAFLAPSAEHFAGTDAVGRDVFARIMAAAQLSLLAALIVIASSVLVGTFIGAVAGAAGGIVDSVLMRFTDLFLSLPAPVLAIAVASAFGRSFQITLFAVAVVWWPLYARIVRGEVRAMLARPHVEAARASGTGGVSVVLRHVLPGAIPPVVVAVSLDIGMVFTTLAGLSFLGLGSPEPSPELGAMAAQGMSYLLNRWWIPVMPALMVFVLAYSANLAGDGLRDFLGRR